MKLTEDRLRQLDDPALTPDRRALLRCRFAAELIHTGQYEAACGALGDFWRGVGNRPDVKGLSASAGAEVLLQCGVLSGWLGSARQIPEAQEKAKDLLTEALRKFESQEQKTKVAEVKYELGRCYYRSGDYDTARAILDEAVKGLKDAEAELKAKALIRRAMIEIWTGRYHDALSILEQAQAFFEKCSDAIRGRWHGQKALVLQRLAITEKRSDFVDSAIVEFTAAIYHYEQAKHEGYAAVNLNNLAMLLYEFGRYEQAHENLDRAITVAVGLSDEGLVAQMNETRARVLVAEHRYEEAERVISGAIKSLEKGGESALLADAVSIQGVIWARLGNHESSLHAIRRAVNVAHDSGSLSNAGQASLTLIEEHGHSRLSESELYSAYRRADELLRDTQDAEVISRLRDCARIALERFSLSAKLNDKDFSLPEAVLAYEAKFIEQALELEAGSVTRAARRLGVKHQTLSHILRDRHKHLLSKRTPAQPRRRSIIRHPSKSSSRSARAVRRVRILHVEDSRAVADSVRSTLELEGWLVDSCSDGMEAFRKIASDVHYDLLLLDNDLPGASGVELIQHARDFRHRRRTLIMMLSATDCEREARLAGADAFLRKPEDVLAIAVTIARLLAGRRSEMR